MNKLTLLLLGIVGLSAIIGLAEGVVITYTQSGPQLRMEYIPPEEIRTSILARPQTRGLVLGQRTAVIELFNSTTQEELVAIEEEFSLLDTVIKNNKAHSQAYGGRVIPRCWVTEDTQEKMGVYINSRGQLRTQLNDPLCS